MWDAFLSFYIAYLFACVVYGIVVIVDELGDFHKLISLSLKRLYYSGQSFGSMKGGVVKQDYASVFDLAYDAIRYFGGRYLFPIEAVNI